MNIKQIHKVYKNLFDYPWLLKDNLISKIKITQSVIQMTYKATEIKMF